MWDLATDRLVACSQEYADIYQMSVSEALQHFVNSDIDHSYIHPEDRKEFQLIEAEALSRKAGFAAEYRIVLPNGPIRHIRAVCEIGVNSEGKVVRMFGTTQDVTKIVNLEEQLRQAQKMEAVGQLTSGIAHDFNNLLTTILGSLEIVSLQMTDNSLKKHIDRAMEAVRRSTDLTDRLLAFSRRQTLKPTKLDVNGVLGGLVKLIQPTLDKDITLETVLFDGLWCALADKNQLENALLNLTLNSKDALDGSGKISFETSNVLLDQAYADRNNEVTPGHYVLITVSDNGVGISPDELDKVFEPFFTTKREGEGSGMGLSMVYGFAKQSKGHVAIHSELRQGTTVELYLPRST